MHALTNFSLFRGSIFVLVLLGVVTRADAQTCNFSFQDAVFDQTDITGSASNDTTGGLKVNCNGDPDSLVLVCASLGAGNGEAIVGTSRKMNHSSSPSQLSYNVYVDPSRTTVWGDALQGGSVPYIVVPLNSTGNGFTMGTYYARIPSPQSDASVGEYSVSLTGSDVAIRYGYLPVGVTCATANLTQTASTAFDLFAFVEPRCSLSGTDMNFGLLMSLSTPATATAQLNVRCTKNVSYQISMNGGESNATDPTQRWLGGTSGISYGLYQDSNHLIPWGSEIAQTKKGVATGLAEVHTVYGRTNPSNRLLAAGDYTDKVIVTLIY